MDPWTIELTVVRNGSHTAAERRQLSRARDAGLLTPIRKGVFVDRAEWESAIGFAGERDRHIVAMRALAAVSTVEPVFSHWSAAVLHGLPVPSRRLDRVHTTVNDPARRGLDGVAAHLFSIESEELLHVRSLITTGVPRSVVDLAGASSFGDGVVVADAALAGGHHRAALEQAVDLAGPRRAAARIGNVLAFAHPGSESAAESETRVSMYRLGIAPQELQHALRDGAGFIAFLDTWDLRRNVGGEVGGATKYLDPAFARAGAGRVLYDEKKREDRARAQLSGFARWGWAEAREPARLAPILARVGLLPERARPTLADYAAVASRASPRRPVVSP